ncbi:HAD hydrolase family protein, partial [Parabacteroides distasonis]|nr:HAD hydrolase family protein [Parabacteroides distasonis]
MAYKIVFFDMDGTLYQTENDIIQESSLQAIQALKEQGYIVCAATGRP